MLFIVGASSLSRTINKLRDPQYTRHLNTSIAEPGLSFKAVKQRKNVQFKLKYEYPQASEVIIWHDAINNRLTPHHNNNHSPLSASELIQELYAIENKIKAIVYCPRQGAPDIFQDLKQTSFVVVHVIKYLLSKRKAKDPSILNDYLQLHPPFCCEIKSLSIVRFHSANLNCLIEKDQTKKA